MDIEKSLTNEIVKSKFKSQFELVNYSILMAEQLIRSGRSPRVDVDNLNPAVIVIEEIVEGEDTLEPVTQPVDKTVILDSKEPREKSKELNFKETKTATEKPVEKKKTRRILAA